MQESKPTARNYRALADAVLNQLSIDWKQAQALNHQGRIRANTSAKMIKYFMKLSNIKD